MDLAVKFRSAVAMVGRFPVLAGVDLDVAKGEIVLLQGSNGAGKTSLLRACAGLLRVVAGEAVVLGEDLVEDPRAVRRRVGLLGHNAALYDDLTAYDNVRFAVRSYAGRVERIRPAMDLLGISGRLADAPVSALSAGQRRRVALAALVARDPELWLLDEPHAGLDAENRDLLDALVTDAVGRGATVVLASHEADRAVALAGRSVIVAGGSTALAAGTAAAVADAVGADPQPTDLASQPGPAPTGGDTPTGGKPSKLIPVKAQIDVA